MGDTSDIPDDKPSAFGKLLLAHRRAGGLTQEELAGASGVSVRALRDLERGRAQAAQRRSAELLADALRLAGSERELFLTLAREGRRRGPIPVGTCALPPRIADLRGRDAELAEIESAAHGGTAVVIVGQPGVGKTTLAVAAAHRLRPLFPDGCLAVDLRGVDEEPVSPRTALDRLLRALGIAAQHVPTRQSEQSALLRSLVEDRQVLFLLDNVADEAQVRPLLVTGTGCLTLVTCRRALGGLEHARRVWLDPLTTPDAVDLLAAIVGPDRVQAEPEDAAELAALCGNLPLAVRIVGNRLATRPRWRLAYLVERLRDESTRLSALAVGDLQVRSAFDLSYQRLSPSARSVFRRLAAIPGADFGVELAEVAVGERGIDRHLDELVEASLLQDSPTPGRFQFHDLIRLFAGRQLETEESPEVCARVRDAVLTYLLDASATAARIFFPDVLETGAFSSRQDASRWLELEGSNWLAAQRVAARLGRHRPVMELARAMHWYSDGRSKEHPWEEVFSLGVTAARALGSKPDEATLLNFVGWAERCCVGDDEAAVRTLRAGLAVAEEIGDEAEQGWAHTYLARSLRALGRLDEALDHARRAAALSGVFTFWIGRCTIQNTLGHILRDLGRYDEALAVHRGVLAGADMYRDEANPEIWRFLKALATADIGRVLLARREWRAAAEAFHAAWQFAWEAGYVVEAAENALQEGIAWREAGEYATARDRLHVAMQGSDLAITRRLRVRVQAELELLPRA
ncbi:ATP-binding protein [Actinokineospora enzanensis]|uniref:ATP-binding protein n=1 Tax=Actinokineospora enzanensis TaxID=155975 RepID=UPI00036AA35A|nr:XRE family transcriptional regulator [Actinokineospora enzanensis]